MDDFPQFLASWVVLKSDLLSAKEPANPWMICPKTDDLPKTKALFPQMSLFSIKGPYFPQKSSIFRQRALC